MKLQLTTRTIFLLHLLQLITFQSMSQCGCIAPNFASASWEKYRCENFETYNTGPITGQSALWSKWVSNSGDAEVRKYSSSSQQYLLVDAALRSDVVFDLGNKRSTQYRTSWRMYVFQGRSGYYNIQKGNRGGATQDWAVNVYFDRNGQGRVTLSNSQLATFIYQHDKWINVMHHYDVQNDIMEIWINNNFVASFKYTLESSNQSLGSIDFYAEGWDRYAVDDICSFEYKPIFEACPTHIDPVCVRGVKEFSNSCYAHLAGYSDLEYRYGSCNNHKPISYCEGFVSSYSEDFENLRGEYITLAQPNYWKLGTQIANSPGDNIDVKVEELGGNYSFGLNMKGGDHQNSNVKFNAGRIDDGYHSISFDLITNYDDRGNLYSGNVILNTPYIGNLTDQPHYEVGISYGRAQGKNFALAYLTKYTQAGDQSFKIVDLPILDSKNNQINPSYRIDFRINRDANEIELYIDEIFQFSQNILLFADRAFEVEFVANFLTEGPTFIQIDNFDFGRCQSKTNFPCFDCSSCFHYFWRDGICYFQSPPCYTQLPQLNSGSPEMETYEWTFPAGCLRGFEGGTNKHSANPMCRLNPGTWEICRTVNIHGEVITSYTCCITIVVQPQNCHEQPPVCHLTYSGAGFNYNLDAGSSLDADHFSWTVEDSETGEPIDMNLDSRSSHNLNLSSYASKCLTFCAIATNCYGYSRFCVTICIPGSNPCQRELPPTCGLITPTLDNDILSFQGVPSGWDSYEWYVPSEFEFTSGSNTSRSPQCKIPLTGRYVVCLVLKYGCSRVCLCFTVGYGCCAGHDFDKIELDIGEAPCQDPGKLVRIPIRVRNFVDINSFNFSVNLDHTRAGVIESIEGQRLSGTYVNGAVISASIATFLWSRPTTVTLADHTIIAYVNVRISEGYGEETRVNVSDHPQKVVFYQKNKLVSDINRYSGKFSVCKRKNASICGSVKRPDGIGIGNAKVWAEDVTSGARTEQITDQNGSYCFTTLETGKTYLIRVDKNINHKNGVNSRDIAWINSHILFVNRLDDAYNVIAADASNDQEVFANDISDILRLTLGYTNEFESNQSWRFVSEEHQFSDPNNPFMNPLTEEIRVSVSNPTVNNIDFIGIKIGDVTLDNNPGQLGGSNTSLRSSGELVMECLSPIEISQDQVAVPVIISSSQGVSDLFNLQFTLEWSGDNYLFQGVRTANSDIGIRNDNFNTSEAANGSLSVVWFDLSGKGQVLNDTTLLFEVIFQTNPDRSTELSMDFSNDPVEILAGSSEEELDVITKKGEFTFTTSTANLDFEININVYPNPVDNYMLVSISGNQQIEHVKIYNLFGKLISDTVVLGESTTIDMSDLVTGAYILQIETNSFISTKTIIKK